MRDVRPVRAVPRWVLGLLAAVLAVHIAWQAERGGGAGAADELAPAPGEHGLRLASFGEAEAAARLAMVFVQSHQAADYGRLLGWLRSALELDPRGQYPLFLAARVYAETGDAARNRIALEFVYREFFRDPDRRWPWLAHAALLAKHRLMQCRHGSPSASTACTRAPGWQKRDGMASENSVTHGSPAACA